MRVVQGRWGERGSNTGRGTLLHIVLATTITVISLHLGAADGLEWNRADAGRRAEGRLSELAECCNAIPQAERGLSPSSQIPATAVTRVLFSPEDMSARSLVQKWMVEEGLTVREDAIGNIFGVWEGEADAGGAILSGSHIDAIPYAGKYDGTVGVIGALEAVHLLRQRGFQPRRSIEVMAFTSEEPTRFGLSCLGSRAMAGTITAATLDTFRDGDGISVAEAVVGAGYGFGDVSTTKGILDSVKKDASNRYDAFVELHIEQGPLLEESKTQLGVVTAIAAPAYLRFSFHGGGGHAGALLMKFRHDAGLAASELALAAERAALESGAEDTVATVGVLELKPGAVNSVPREGIVHVDIRDVDSRRRDEAMQKIIASAREISERRGVAMRHEIVVEDPAMRSDDDIVATIENAAKGMGVTHKKMVSRAYHDSSFIGQYVPSAMIFIPCRNGWSHRPDEFSREEDLAVGIEALARTFEELSSRGPGWGHDDL